MVLFSAVIVNSQAYISRTDKADPLAVRLMLEKRAAVLRLTKKRLHLTTVNHTDTSASYEQSRNGRIEKGCARYPKNQRQQQPCGLRSDRRNRMLVQFWM